MNRNAGLLVWVMFLSSACASGQRPVLYPNDQMRRLGDAAAERDIDDCMARAESYIVSRSQTRATLEEASTAAVGHSAVGAAGGAAGGAIVGRAATGAAIGAAGGAAAGATRGLIRGLFSSRHPSQVQKSFVNRCLREKGYEPIGWS